MKILLATSAIIPNGGGIASYNQELLSVIKEGNIVSVLTDEDLTTYEGLHTVYSTKGDDCYSFDYCKEKVDLLNNERYDLIINSNSLLISIIAPYLNSPICSVSHFVNGRLALIAGHNAQYINRIVALSYYGKKFLDNYFAIEDKEKVQVVYNFIHTETRPFDEAKIAKRPLIIVYPGGTSVKKSFDVVMRALRKLIKTDLDFKFYWLGGLKLPSSKLCLASDVSKLIRKDSRIFFTGKILRDEAMAIMQSANVFLLPSRGEGCPMTLLEAMQGGCIPVVSDAKHGSREILENGNFGVIVKNDDSRELFTCLSKILTQHEKYEGSYRVSYDYIREELSESKWITQMQNIIVDCIKDKKDFINIEPVNFKMNAQALKRSLKKIRFETMLASMKTSIICNYMYLSK